MRSAFKTPAVAISLAGVAIGYLMLATTLSSIVGTLLFIPFALGPLLVTGLLAIVCQQRWPLVVLSFAGVAYSAWFTWWYLAIFYSDIDLERTLPSVFFIGAYSLPVIIPIWVVVIILEWRAPPQGESADGKPVEPHY